MMQKTMMSYTKNPHRLRLRTTLVVPFVLQIIAAVGLVGYLSFLGAQKAINDLSSQLRAELSSRIERELKSYFTTPHTINRLNAAALTQGDLKFDNSQGVTQMYQQVKVSPYIFGVYCGSTEGEFLGAGRSETGSDEVQMWLVNATTQNRFYNYELDERGNRSSFVKDDGEYDPRQRPWFQTALQKQQPTWSEIYLDFATHLPVLTAITPVYKDGNDVLGVCATDVQLPVEFRKFLSSLEIGKTGEAFVVSRTGQLISDSTNNSLTIGSGDNTSLVQAIKSSNPLIQQTSQFLQQQFGEFNQIRETQQLDFISKGQRQLIQVLPFQDGKGLDWLIVVTVPESDFMSLVYATTRNSILLALAALAVAIGIGILTARWITRPILKMSQASNKLAQGDLDQQVAPSPIVEIDTLASSFNRMAGQLKSSFTALEQKNEELRIAEENYRSIFENALEGIFQSSPQGRFINVNPALAKIYGYSSPAKMMESITNIADQLYVDSERRAEFQELLEKHGTVKNFEYRCYCQDGSIIWTQIDARVVRDSNGKVIYYEGIVQDTTERKRREDELRQQLEELRIEIDHQKRKEEVETLTASTYFQEVQQEMAKVDIDEFWS